MADLAFSIGLADCEVQTFRSGGKGGQHQNKTESGVRVIHRDSGARGESREHRSQYQNKRAAFTRMVETTTFQTYIRRRLYGIGRAEAEVAREMEKAENFLIEGREDGRWVPMSDAS
jgi:protein subunit release factor B